MWHFPTWPHIYSFVFTNLRHICKEQNYPKKLQVTNKIATHYTCKLGKKMLVTTLLWNHSQVQIVRIWTHYLNHLWTKILQGSSFKYERMTWKLNILMQLLITLLILRKKSTKNRMLKWYYREWWLDRMICRTTPWKLSTRSFANFVLEWMANCPEP